MDVYHREVKPIFLTKFRSAYGTKKFNDMYVFLLHTQVAPWSDIRCGTNPDFDVDKDGWVWPNAVKGKNCSKVVYLQSSLTSSEKLIHEFQKNYILDLGDVIQAHQPKANDEEGTSDESVTLRVENIIDVSKLQEWVNLSSQNE